MTSSTTADPGRRLKFRVPSWTTVVPVLSIIGLALTWERDLPVAAVAIVAILLGVAVLAAVHHAEVVAHRVGEPYGSLVLAVAVTVIEVALIVTLMVSGPDKSQTLARDTVFSAVMITCAGIIGISLLTATLRRAHEVVFNADGARSALAVIVTLTALCLVLPTFTTSRSLAEFTGGQLAFAAVVSIVLYGVFVFTQTVRHRDYFLPVDRSGNIVRDGAVLDGDATSTGDNGDPSGAEPTDGDDENGEHADPPSNRAAYISLGLLAVSLVGVVGLAKVESPAIEAGVAAVGFPPSVVGIIIALLVLLPETLAAVRAARRGRVQTSLNLALGSAMASIGMTIPAIALASIWLPGPVVLGLGPTQIVLFVVIAVVTALTVIPGRASLMQAVVHVLVLASFLVFAIMP